MNDPLAQLRDIHLPDSVGFWPPAPGWWILAAILIAAIVTLFIFLRRRRARNAYRKAAQLELADAWLQLQQNNDQQYYLSTMAQILRRAAIAAFPYSNVATLQGEAWLEFLDNTSNSNDFTQGPGRQLLTLPYQPISSDNNISELHTAVDMWIAKHRRTTPLSRKHTARSNYAAV